MSLITSPIQPVIGPVIGRRRAAGGAAAALLLDTYTGAAFAADWAFQIRTAYSGRAGRAYRFSDSAEQDIPYNGGVLDQSALTTFIGAGNGGAALVADQALSGIGDVSQITEANLPLIVSSGVVITDNGQPAIQFDGVNDALVHTTALPDTAAISMFSVITPTDGNGRFLTVAKNNPGYLFLVAFDAANDEIDIYDGAFTSVAYTFAQTLLTQVFVEGVSKDAWLNGASIIDAASSAWPGLADATNSIAIGCDRKNGNHKAGKVQSQIVYLSDQSANREAIEADMNSRYGVF